MTLDIDSAKIESIIRHVAETEVAPRFRNLQTGEIREKKPGDFVTVADEASEELLSQLLAEALPGSLVVGEEAVAKDAGVLARLKGDAPVWVIDPIDGTYNFAHGRSRFGVLVGLVRGGVTQHGWAYDVPGNRMIAAAKGAGVFLDGARLRVATPAQSLKDMTGQVGGAQAWHFDSVRPLFKELLNFRCALYDYLHFLTGQADFILHINKVTPWDHAAANLMAAEAGGFTALNDDGAAYDPTYFGPAFMLAAPSREWCAPLRSALSSVLRKKPAS